MDSGPTAPPAAKGPLFAAPRLKHLFSLRCKVATPQDVGHGPYGFRRCISILGGSFWGEHMEGKIVPGGADFLLRDEATQAAYISTNYLLETNDGAFIYVRTTGCRHGSPEAMLALTRGDPIDRSQYTFHLSVVLETGHEKYKWLNNRTIVAVAGRGPELVEYDAYYLDED